MLGNIRAVDGPTLECSPMGGALETHPGTGIYIYTYYESYCYQSLSFDMEARYCDRACTWKPGSLEARKPGSLEARKPGSSKAPKLQSLEASV